MKSTTTRAYHLAIILGTTGALALSACSGGGGFQQPQATQGAATGPVSLKLMIGSSGDAETNSVKAAVDAWSQKSGNKVEVVPAADLSQQLGQAFAGGNPPDVFYTGAEHMGDYAKAGYLYPYGDQVKDAGSSSRSSPPSPQAASSTAHPRTTRRSPSSSTVTCGPRPA